MNKQRILRLLKKGLIFDLKDFFAGIGLLFVITAVVPVVNLFVIRDGFQSTGVNLLTFGFMTFMMLLHGIIVGSKIPSKVRKGTSRVENFISVAISIAIIGILIYPLLMVLNMILNMITGVPLNISNWNINTLLVQMLTYIAVFYVGMFIALLWQKVGWILALIIIFVTFVAIPIFMATPFRMTGSVTLTLISTEVLNDGLLGPIETIVYSTPQNYPPMFFLIIVIIIFTTATFFMMRKLNVKAA